MATRLHQNHGAYRGETIRVRDVLEQLRSQAQRCKWTVEELYRPKPDLPVWAFTRPAATKVSSRFRLYVSAGIHGDEPAGPLAMFELLRADGWPEDCDLFVCPCLNPVGLERNQREGLEGKDLNRDYRNPQLPAVRAHVAWLRRQPQFDLSLLLHEDWEADGFYLYDLRQGASHASEIIRAVSAVCPILKATVVDGWPASGGIARPNVDPQTRPDWPEALYLREVKSKLNYTFEAPSDYPLPVRTHALVTATEAAIAAWKTPRDGRER